jgi:hypothetical protein
MRTFTNAVLLSVVSGKMCCHSFCDIHECIEYLEDSPIFTHMIPRWVDARKDDLKQMFPDLASYDVSGLNRETADQWIKDREEFLKATRLVPKFSEV